VLTIASTGLRIGEAIALQRRHLVLDGSDEHERSRHPRARARRRSARSAASARTG
jgi:hypothetical protein